MAGSANVMMTMAKLTNLSAALATWPTLLAYGLLAYGTHVALVQSQAGPSGSAGQHSQLRWAQCIAAGNVRATGYSLSMPTHFNRNWWAA